MAIDNPYDAPAGDPRPSHRSRWLFWLATLGVGGLIVVALLLPMSRPGASNVARRVACAHNLRHIALALQAYDQQHGSLPPACRGSFNCASVDGFVNTFTPTDTDEGGPDVRRSLLRTDDRKIDLVD